MAGYILAIAVFLGLYYSNVWNARNFPFLSPQLFSQYVLGSYFPSQSIDKN